MSVKIQLKRTTASAWTSLNPTLDNGEFGYETDTAKFKIGNGSTAWTSLAYANANLSVASLDALSDVTITSATNGDFLRWNGSAWINDAVNLATDTIGSYVESLVAGTGVTLSNNSGEGSTPTVAIGQDVASSATPTFAGLNLNGNIVFEGTTANDFETTISVTDPTADRTITFPDATTTVVGTDTTQTLSNKTLTTPVINGPTITATGQTPVIHGILLPATHNIIFEGTTDDAFETTLYVVDPTADRTVSLPDATTTLVGKDTTDTLTNKTLTSPKINEDVALTATATELNYVDGVTSAIQTQIDTKAPSNSPTFTGTVTIPDNTVALGTKTTGDYVASLVAGTGVTLTNNSGETATPTVAIGQAVGTTDNVTFAGVTADAIKIGVTAAGEIDTTSGNLTIDSAGGTVTIDDNLTVTGNLTVSGTTTSINTETLTVDDNIIVLNNNVTSSPTENAGIEVERGTSTNVSVRWNETNDKWEFTNDGSTYGNIAALGTIALGTDTTGNYVSSLVAGTGIALTNNSGESATPTVALNATLDNLSDAVIGTVYSIGDTGPAGGKIFITPSTSGNTTGKYFEASPSASEVIRKWASPANINTEVSGAQGIAIGTGAQNTIDIVAQSGNVAESCAAAYASDYSVNGYSDWFLPSQDEIVKLYESKALIGGLGNATYWSSTESDNGAAVILYSSVNAEVNGTTSEYNKNNDPVYVRAVRSFDQPTASSGDYLKWNGTAWVNQGGVVNTGDTGTVTSTMILNGTIVNADINASAAIVDTKLATISTAGKVSNSATTATDANTANAIVARDASGNFTAGTITGALSGNASTATTLATARNIAGQSFNGSANISIAPTDLTGVTSTAAEINILDGATLSTAELNILDGVTASASELNILDGASLTTTELNYVDGVTSAIQTQIDTKAPTSNPTFTGTVSGISKSMVGLGNVDNTSDANKPVSTAQQNAIDLKANINSPTFTGTVSGINSTMVGLGSVNNTSDQDKPISTATQTALDLKAPLASPTFSGTPSLPTGTTAVTQTAGNNTTALATTAFIQTALGNYRRMTASDTAPSVDVTAGDFWYDTTGLNLYIYVGSAWVQVTIDEPIFFELAELIGVVIDEDLATNQTLRFDGVSGNWVNSFPRQNVSNSSLTTYGITSANNGGIVVLDSSSAVSVNLGTWTDANIGEKVDIVQKGTGQVSITVSGAVSVVSPSNSVTTRVRYSTVTATCIGANLFLLSGDLA